MGNKKQIHYNLDNIDKIGARFNLIYGEIHITVSGVPKERC